MPEGPKSPGGDHNRGREFPIEVLAPAEVTALIRTCSTTAATGLRNRALIAVLYRSGLRISEALALHPKDVDAESGWVTVLRGKGGKRRVASIDDSGLSHLGAWTERRRTLGLTGRHPLFCTLKGTALKDSYVRELLPRLAQKAGVEKRVHPHGLRHTHAYDLAGEGKPITLIQDQLGHSTLAVTERYLKHVAPHDRIRLLRDRPTWDTE